MKFGQAYAAGVEDLQNGAVAGANGSGVVRGLQHALDLPLPQESGEGTVYLDAHAAARRHRGGGEEALLDEELVERPDHAKLSDNADPGVAAAAGAGLSDQPTQIAAQQLAVHVGEAEALPIEIIVEGRQVGQIDADGVFGEAPLAPQERGESLQKDVELGHVR